MGEAQSIYRHPNVLTCYFNVLRITQHQVFQGERMSKSLMICSAIMFLGLNVSAAGKSDDVLVSFTPASPIVIDSDLRIDDYTTSDPTDTIDIAGPWFRAELEAKNNSNTTVTIVGFVADIIAPDGQTTHYKSNLGSDQFYITVLLPGEQYDSDFGWYINNLPTNKSFRYNVNATVIGWFGTPNAPQERFERKISFVTQ
jgi:hypothetical protein